MSLAPGDELGPYNVLGAIGAGHARFMPAVLQDLRYAIRTRAARPAPMACR